MLNKLLSELFPQTQKLQDNYETLLTEVNKVGKIYERKSYEELLLPAEQNSIEITIGDRTLYFSAEAYNIKSDGTLCFCIDADGLPTLWGVKPSYQFYKRRDGSVYY